MASAFSSFEGSPLPTALQFVAPSVERHNPPSAPRARRTPAASPRRARMPPVTPRLAGFHFTPPSVLLKITGSPELGYLAAEYSTFTFFASGTMPSKFGRGSWNGLSISFHVAPPSVDR